MQTDPTFLAKMKSGYACIGNTQFLRGYCVLFSDPSVPTLNDLNIEKRADFLMDMSILGDAIISVCKPLRINYGILGNSHPHLHAHLFPRYDNEPDYLKTRNVWQYPEEFWIDKKYKYNDQSHAHLKNALMKALNPL